MSETLSSVNVMAAPSAPPRPEPPRTPPPPATGGRRAALFSRLAHALPTLLVLAVLGGLASWGHHTGWKLPKFSALTGNGAAASDDWCPEHSVAETQCVECNPTLLPRKTFGWCSKHGVHDCPWEHPEVAQLKTTPSITPADLERAERALKFAPRPGNSSSCKLHLRTIQFASAEAVAKQGIRPDEVRRDRIEETAVASGEIGYDPTRLASLSTPVPGKVWRVEKEIGQPVQKDEVLALVDAIEVGKAKAEFRQALAQVELRGKLVDSMRPGVQQGAIPEARFREVETSLREAQIQLATAQQTLLNLGLPVRAEDLTGLNLEEAGRRIQFLGLPGSIIQTLDSRSTTSNLIPIKAPLDGIVVARKAVVGEVADAAKPLFVVADTRQMWLTLHVRLEDARHLAIGQLVRFEPDGGGEKVSGPLAWISTAVDERTRTVEARVDLANPAGRLRANTFGTGTIVLRAEDQAIVVANEALHWDGNCHVVFVRDRNFFQEGAPKVFYPRSVRPGVRNAQYTEIIAGVLPGEHIAGRNSGVLRAELLKNNLGAG